MSAQEEWQRLDRDTGAGMSAVAPMAHGSSRPVPSVKVQLKAPACSSRSSGVSPYQPSTIIRRAQIARWAWATALGSPDEPEVKTR
jgi:hypothetical protein